jgi:hypothetical protein
VLKEIAFNRAKALATMFLRWSDFWGDVAESIKDGVTIAEIRARREKASG